MWCSSLYIHRNPSVGILVPDSVAQVIAAHDSPAYQTVLKALGNTAKRDVRVIEGIG